jgi:hypothetical protein
MALGASRSAAASTTPSSPGNLSVPLAIPWTIANRYYAADVHFSAWTMERLFPDLFDREPPALVFVWSEGQVDLNYYLYFQCVDHRFSHM